MATAAPLCPLLHSDRHFGNCPNEGGIIGIDKGLSGSPAAAAMTAVVVAVSAATETTGETAHECHPADGAVPMGVSALLNGYRSPSFSLWGAAATAMATPFYPLLHSDKYTGLAG